MGELDLNAIDPGEIGRLMKLLSSTDVEECDIQNGEYSISIKRAAAPSGPIDRAAEDSAPADEEEAAAVLSTAVGVFHRSESSESGVVGPGARVKAGEVIGVIEVMGVPHPVLATLDGTIDAFLVEDGEAVEYGQPIASYRPVAESR